MIAELDVVELIEDLPTYCLKANATGTVVEVFDSPAKAYMVEFVIESGASSIIADWVRPNQIRLLE